MTDRREPQPTVPETPRDVLGAADNLVIGRNGRIIFIEGGMRRFYVGLNSEGQRVTINRDRITGEDVDLKVTDATGKLLAHGTMSRGDDEFKPIHVIEGLGSVLVTLEPDHEEMDRLVDESTIQKWVPQPRRN